MKNFIKYAGVAFGIWLAASSFLDVVKLYANEYFDGLGSLYINIILILAGLGMVWFLEFRKKKK